MQRHRSSSVMGKSTAEMKSSGAAVDERRPMMFHTRDKSSASKSSEEPPEGALSPSRHHQQNYGATTTLHSESEGPSDLVDCQGHKNIHGVFEKLVQSLPSKDLQTRRKSSQHISSSSDGVVDGEANWYSLAAVRSFALLLALSVHTTFEGLAIGMQHNAAEVWILFGAVSFHKVMMSFTSGVRFVQSLSSWRYVLLAVAVLALASPAGVAVGLVVTETAGQGAVIVVTGAILQGLAAGTFVYVTFFEVLYEHLSTHCACAHEGRRLLKIFAVIVGFGCLAVLEIFTPKLCHN